MKKQLFLFAVSALALSSCMENDTQNYDLDTLSGDWKTVKVQILSGTDNATVLNTTVPTDCAVNNITTFRTDYFTSYKAYSGATTPCTATITDGTYTYKYNTRNLGIKLKNDNGAVRTYKVVILGNHELVLRQTFGAVDFNNDQVNDFVYVHYTK